MLAVSKGTVSFIMDEGEDEDEILAWKHRSTKFRLPDLGRV